MKKLVLMGILVFCLSGLYSQIVVNHNNTEIKSIPLYWIAQAKDSLHIAYGHTSHGSQLTDGMSSLVNFINGGGLGTNYPVNIFNWNHGGNDGALDLHDYAMDGDCGYYPQWVTNTTNYLGPVNAQGRGTYHPDVNVIIWSWCGQIDDKYAAGTLESEYINPMNNLENTYFGIKFVYMTGHLDHWDDANNKAANNFLRNYCALNNKILYDFADIESYDPDAVFYEFAGDDCSYYESASGNLIGNWATNWQNTHTENVDWYNCSCAHSQALNGNRKAYAAWSLWSKLAGWQAQSFQNCFPADDTTSHSFNNQLAIQYISSHSLTGITVTKTLNAPGIYGSITDNHQNIGDVFWSVNSSSGDNGEFTLKINTTGLSGINNFNNLHVFTRDSLNGQWYDTDSLSGVTVQFNNPEIIVSGLTHFSEYYLTEIAVNSNHEILAYASILQLKSYPNPFNPETNISFSLNQSSNVILTVYNCKGQKVKTLINGNCNSGNHQIIWNGKDDKGKRAATGLYFISLESGKDICRKKVVMIK